jgi:hypothetical protein
VFSDECQVADANFVTPTEAPPPPPPIDQCDPATQTCSPIVINFANGEYALTGANAPVWFDIAATGTPRLIGWTAAGADEAFLWLDRDGNGKVDSGAELFGNATSLRSGAKAANGFEALREFDDNGDGVIDEHDAIWSRLMLWRDLNHNGISDSDEITPLAGSGVLAIELNYHWTGRRDPYGNIYRYESHLWLENPNGRPRSKPVYDIYFIVLPP